MPQLSTRHLLAAVAVIFCAAAGAGLAWRSGTTLDAAGAKIDPAVIKALESGESVRVIVSLDAKPQVAADGGDLVSSLAASTAAEGADVLAAVAPADFTPERRYQAVPAIAGTASAHGVAALAAQPGVTRVSLDLKTHAELAQAAALTGADDVHTSLGVTGAGVVVAILDSGIDTDHPLLSDDLIHEQCYLASGACPGGGTSGTSAEDDNGHGTHVSGIVTSNGPPEGIAPDASVEAYKVLASSGSGVFSDILMAYDDIITNHAEVDVINMSLTVGGAYAADACDPLVPAFATAVATTRAMGMISFAAAGNSGEKSGIGYPACASGVVSVGAVYDAALGTKTWTGCTDMTTAADKVVCFSQSHLELDLLAPGSVITSTVLGGGTGDSSGTSMASPMAAGAAALLLESEPGLTPDQVETRLRETGVAVTDAANGVATCRINVYEAVLNDGGPVCASSGPAGPVNDDFVNATALGASPPQAAAQSTLNATTEVGEPSPCAGIASTVWYRFEPASDGVLVADTFGSGYDGALAVYEGTSLASLTPLDCNDDSVGQQSQVTFAVTSGLTYYLQAGGFLGASGSLVLHLDIAPPTPTPLPTKQPNGDTDGDGCLDLAENGPNEELGGRRDYLNPWDFFDPNGDRVVDLLNDIFAVAGAFGATTEDAAYSTALDRSPPPSEAEEPDPSKRELWDLGPPDGTVDLLNDLFGVAYQFGHDCR